MIFFFKDKCIVVLGNWGKYLQKIERDAWRYKAGESGLVRKSNKYKGMHYIVK